MDIRENIRIAIFSIKTNMMRSLLTMLGIIIGVASVISIITIGNGGRDYIVGMIEDMGSNAIQISVNANTANQSNYITEEDISSIKKLGTVSYCSPMNSHSVRRRQANMTVWFSQLRAMRICSLSIG